MKKLLIGFVMLASVLRVSADLVTSASDIQGAIDAAAPGGTVELAEGTFSLSAELNLHDGVTLKGQGWEKTIINRVSGNSIRLAKLDGGSRLEGVTLTGGKPNDAGAGALVLDGTISWCCISNNVNGAHNKHGGGISFSGGKGTIDHCIIAYNKTTGQGAYGAGIGADGPVGEILVDSCLIYGNKITGNGSGGGIGIKNMNATLTVRNCTITGNAGTMYSGGIRREGGSGKIAMLNNILTNNGYGSGGAMSTAANFSGNVDADNSANCLFGLETEVNMVKGSFSGDPKFVDAANGNYRLDDGSPAIGKGVTYEGIGTDLDNVAFAATPAIGCYEYVAAAQVNDPVFAPETGTGFYPSLAVELTCTTLDATIRYTTDESDPDETSAAYDAEHPITLNDTTTVKARAYLQGRAPSEIVTAVYTLIVPDPPEIGTVTVKPSATKARVTGEITSLGNNGATACDVYISLNGNEARKIASGVTSAFSAVVRGLDCGTEYAYTLSVSNNAAFVMGAETHGEFTTAAEDVPLTPSGDDDTELIMGELDGAEDGDTVELGEGTFLLSETILLDKGVTLKGAGADKTVLNFQKKCRGVRVTAEGAVLEGVAVLQGYVKGEHGGGIYMTAGLARNCCVTNCTLDSGNAQTRGGGVYMNGGTLEGCEITVCQANGLYSHGNALTLEGGTATNCDIHNNDGGYSHTAIAMGDAVVYLTSGTLAASKIHDNNKDSVPGVHQVNGTMVNCLVYNNTAKNGSAGICKDNGFTYNCTVYNCVLSGDATGISGFSQANGTTKNCIVWASHPEASTAGSVSVTGGTFENNVTEVEVGTGTKTGDPVFVGAETNDFRITRASSAYQTGLPLADVKVDIAGLARDAEKPCIGAYEFDPSSETFELRLKLAKDKYPVNEEVVVEAVVTGAGDETLPVAWTLNGETLETTEASVTLMDLVAGAYVIKASVEHLGRVASQVAAFAVQPSKVYVNNTGSGTYPYATEETATNSFEAAFAALYSSFDTTGEVVIGAGVYTNLSPITLSNPVTVRGAGQDATTIVCTNGITAFSLANDAATLCDLALSGQLQGAAMSAGKILRCRFADCRYARQSQDAMGAGVNLSGGLVEGCLFERCSAAGVYGRGAAAYLTGGVVSNCIIRQCTAGAIFESAFGGSVCLINGGLVANCRIEDATGSTFPAFCNNGGTMRNVYVTGTAAGASAMAYSVGTVENCTIARNAVGEGQCAVRAPAGVFRNNIVWNNVGGESTNVITVAQNCCYPDAEEGAAGNTAKDPQLKKDGRIKSSSPCRNAGVNQPWMEGAVDLNGNPRIRNGVVDMGAFEVLGAGFLLMLK